MKIDKTDMGIIEELTKDGKMSYEQIAKKLGVSAGTIHVRLNKLKDAGVVTGSRITVDYKKLGFHVTAFIGVNLRQAKDHRVAIVKLKKMPEVTDIYYTTGNYSLFVKVMVKTPGELHQFLSDKVQLLPEVHSTETLISLDQPLSREYPEMKP